jgi:glycosyltransferase involved in cell wall biosynthesis
MGSTFQERLRSISSLKGFLHFCFGLVHSSIILMIQFLKAPPAEVILVGYPGYFHVHLARILKHLKRSKAIIAYDIFFSLYDTIINDRQLVSAGSMTAKLIKFVDAAACHASDLVVVDTQSHGDFIAKALNVPKKKLAVVYVGPTFSPCEAPHSLDGPKSRIDILFIGTYIPLHGIPTIIESADILKNHPGVHFTLIGKGQLRTEMEKTAKKLGLTNIAFIDWIPADRLCKTIRAADLALGIFGTTDKAQRVIPIKVYDICAAGGAIITSDSPAIREVFRNGKDVILVPPGDARALSNAIIELCSNDDFREQIRKNAHRLSKTIFSIESIGKKAVEAFNRK